MQTCYTSLFLLTTLSLSQGGVVFPSDRSNDSRSLISLFENSRDNILSSLSRPHSFSEREKRIKDKLQTTISQLVELMFKQEQMKVFNQDEINFGENETESNFETAEESIENMSTENIIFQETTLTPETNEETTEPNLKVDDGKSEIAKLQLRPRRLDNISDRTLSKIGMYSDAVNFENSGNSSLNEVDGPIEEFECDEITNVCGKHPKYPGDKFARALARGNKLTLKMVEALATNPAPAIEELPQPEMRSKHNMIGLRARHNMPQEIGLRSSSFELFSARSAPSPMKGKMEAEAENICKTISKQVKIIYDSFKKSSLNPVSKNNSLDTFDKLIFLILKLVSVINEILFCLDNAAERQEYRWSSEMDSKPAQGRGAICSVS